MGITWRTGRDRADAYFNLVRKEEFPEKVTIPALPFIKVALPGGIVPTTLAK
jgi:hypothetical protein